MAGDAAREQRHRSAWTDAAVCLVAFALDWVSKDGAPSWRWGGPISTQAVLSYHLVGGLLLLGRRRAPLLTFGAAWVYGLGRLAVQGVTPWAVPLFALQSVAVRCSPALTRRATLAVVVPLCIDVALGHEVGERDPTGIVATLTTLAFATFCALWLGSRERANARSAQLAEERLEQVAVEVLAAERRRLARELHDSLGHAITAMTLQAAGAKAVGATRGIDPLVVRSLDAIEETGTGAMRELHRLLGVLRMQGEVHTERTAQPGLTEIDALVAASRAGGLDVRLERQGTSTPDDSVAFAMYRVTQEALVNAMRHDGPGAVVDVVLTTRPEEAIVEVTSRTGSDRHTPREAPSGGFGLSGLRERVLLVGGRFSAGVTDGAFVTRAIFPTRAPTTRTAGPAVAPTRGDGV